MLWSWGWASSVKMKCWLFLNRIVKQCVRVCESTSIEGEEREEYLILVRGFSFIELFLLLDER